MGLVGLAGVPGQRDGGATSVGAALTYARRYALFTLVGIAGEDDLDAPDLEAAPKAGADQPPRPNGGSSNGHAFAAGLTLPGAARRKAAPARPLKPVLEADQSAALRERLVAELNALQSADEAAGWAHRGLPAENTLTAADADVVEAGFRAKLATFDDRRPADGLQEAGRSPPWAKPSHPNADAVGSPAATEETSAGRVLPVGKTIRLRDKDHRKFVSKQPCLVCGREPSDPHHLRFAQPRALGRKVSDEFMVPVCRLHHRELHRHGDEAAWWTGVNIDPVPIALALWQSTHPNGAFSPVREAVQAHNERGYSLKDGAGTRMPPRQSSRIGEEWRQGREMAKMTRRASNERRTRDRRLFAARFRERLPASSGHLNICASARDMRTGFPGPRISASNGLRAGEKAFKWAAATRMVGIGILPCYGESFANAVKCWHGIARRHARLVPR